MIPELEEIKHIFLHEWDPIGVAGIPEAVDEYDSYAFQVFTSLHQGATADSIADYLGWAEFEHMGLTTGSERINEVSERVMQVHARSAER
jgi:hypothetical protein